MDNPELVRSYPANYVKLRIMLRGQPSSTILYSQPIPITDWWTYAVLWTDYCPAKTV